MSFPISAILSFGAPGVDGKLNRTQKGFKSLEKSIQTAGKQMQAIGAGVKSAAVATTPLIAATGLSVAAFADFESQMSIVKSLTKGITEKEFKEMTAEAKRLGSTTSFTSKEAGDGFEFLAKAGFNAAEQIGSLETVLNVAAAGSLDLGRASDILTDSLGALNPMMDQHSNKVEKLISLGDKFAFIQATTNTNIEQLGEAIAFGGGTMANFGFEVDDIIASMGALANSALKGSTGGTNLAAMFNKLFKSGGKTENILRGMGVEFSTIDNKMRSIPDIVDDLIVGLSDIEDPAERSSVSMQLFGRQGIRAFNALKSQGTNSLRLMADGIKNSMGEAARQARERLDNLKGGFTRFTSAVSGILIEFGGVVGKHIRKPVEKAAMFLSLLSVGFQLATGAIKKTGISGKIFFKTFGPEKGQKVIDFISGFIEGIKTTVTTVTNLTSKARAFIETFIGANDSFEDIGRSFGEIGSTMVIVMPLIAILGAGLIIIGPILFGIVQLFGLMFTIIGFLLSPIGLVIAAVAGIGLAVFILWDDIKFFAGEIGGLLVSAFEDPLSAVDSMVDFVSFMVGNIGKDIRTILGNAFVDSLISAELKLRVINERIFNNIKTIFSTLGAFIFDVIANPVDAILNLVKGLISKIAGTTLGKFALKTAGIELGALQGFLKDTSFSALSKGANIEQPKVSASVNKVADVAKVQSRSIEQKSLVAPQSSEILKKDVQQPTQQTQNIIVTPKIFLDSKQIAVGVAKHKIENGERSGKSMLPIEKRRAIENG